jgi:hypothetical protein
MADLLGWSGREGQGWGRRPLRRAAVLGHRRAAAHKQQHTNNSPRTTARATSEPSALIRGTHDYSKNVFIGQTLAPQLLQSDGD